MSKSYDISQIGGGRDFEDDHITTGFKQGNDMNIFDLVVEDAVSANQMMLQPAANKNPEKKVSFRR